MPSQTIRYQHNFIKILSCYFKILDFLSHISKAYKLLIVWRYFINSLHYFCLEVLIKCLSRTLGTWHYTSTTMVLLGNTILIKIDFKILYEKTRTLIGRLSKILYKIVYNKNGIVFVLLSSKNAVNCI